MTTGWLLMNKSMSRGLRLTRLCHGGHRRRLGDRGYRHLARLHRSAGRRHACSSIRCTTDLQASGMLASYNGFFRQPLRCCRRCQTSAA